MATLLLVRHGETDWTRDHLWQGQAGPGLNDVGRRQAAQLSSQITNIDAVYSSDAPRAYETAEIVAARQGLPVHTDARLREVDFGHWEGLTRAQIDERFAGAFARWLTGDAIPDGGESDREMADRVFAVLSEIAERHPHARILVVTSGGPIRAVEAQIRGVDQAAARCVVDTVPNCSLVEVVIRDGTWLRSALRPAALS